MYILGSTPADLGNWIEKEIAFSGDIKAGKRGVAAKRVQEWLSLNGHQVVIDADFGPVTKDAVIAFQKAKKLTANGVVNKKTYAALTAPLTAVLTHKPRKGLSFGETVMSFAKAHLAQHPLEIGGANRGPWVRTYMKGNEGTPWAWCAGFTTFCMYQAAETLGVSVPIKGSFSCDTLAAQARAAGNFLSERNTSPGALSTGSMFLVRRTSTDWTHVGFVVSASDTSFTTIEGNTNDDGHREGFEVCARRRGYKNRDFIIL